MKQEGSIQSTIFERNNISLEQIDYGDIKYFRKKKLQSTIQNELLTAKYESKKNVCKKCFTTISLLGECMC